MTDKEEIDILKKRIEDLENKSGKSGVPVCGFCYGSGEVAWEGTCYYCNGSGRSNYQPPPKPCTQDPDDINW